MPFTARGKDRARSRFEMRLSASEHNQLREDADLAGISISELVRRRALSKPVRSSVDLLMVRELRRLGGLQKLTMNTLIAHGGVKDECVKAIQALRAAIERVAGNDH